jgi:3-isopropylmalate/(R)-2-methylmalate dehydratase small subunit
MKQLQTLTSRIIPLVVDNIDTDQIIPARYLKVTDKEGLSEGLFAGWRYREDGEPDPNFPLNQPAHRAAQILLAGENFGCGSSREHAPWALLGWGIRAVISTSFADIFYNNALKNGLLPVSLPANEHKLLHQTVREQPDIKVQIDLAPQTIRIGGDWQADFPIDTFNKTCLLEGIDQLGYIQKFSEQIAAYERANGATA